MTLPQACTDAAPLATSPLGSLGSFRNITYLRLDVGPDPDYFWLPEHHLRTCAPNFPLVPADSRSTSIDKPSCLSLPNHDPLMIDRFVTWVHFGQIGLRLDRNIDRTAQPAAAQTMLDLYLFAREVHCQDLMEYITQCFQRLLQAGWQPSGDYLTSFVRRTDDQCALQDLLLDACIQSRKPSWYRSAVGIDLLADAPDLHLLLTARLAKLFHIHLRVSSKRALFDPLNNMSKYHQQPLVPQDTLPTVVHDCTSCPWPRRISQAKTSDKEEPERGAQSQEYQL